jgi:hypothetical protein
MATDGLATTQTRPESVNGRGVAGWGRGRFSTIILHEPAAQSKASGNHSPENATTLPRRPPATANQESKARDLSVATTPRLPLRPSDVACRLPNP